MSDAPQQQSNVSAFFATVWGKVISALAVVAMVLGIYMEFVGAYRATYDAIRAKADSEAAVATARAKTSRPAF